MLFASIIVCYGVSCVIYAALFIVSSVCVYALLHILPLHYFGSNDRCKKNYLMNIFCWFTPLVLSEFIS